ncbi:hypothetical protein UCRNP2_8991 [Neofusicoccum parvum UCRNP2]|uniref:DNA/RNA-binding protein Alba-like domain-containing protein n=1 Tax=Botryosphaeria parva (strain UCR-NP2) TaxID=1287680 RepID=R1E935_BOTPV|nr:hypothetical protein UCRNP2_8991 [Neofusicoccum parvum UCRNP2]
MAKTNKHRPPSSPAADPVSSKRRRLTHADNAASPVSASPPASAASARGTCARSAVLTAPTIYVVAGSKIQAKVRATIAALSADARTKPPSPSAADVGATGGSVKPASAHEGSAGVVLLEARAPAASKLITIAEVAKRALDDEQKRCKKVRNVPVLAIYLAMRPVPALKALYEEQCSEP